MRVVVPYRDWIAGLLVWVLVLQNLALGLCHVVHANAFGAGGEGMSAAGLFGPAAYCSTDGLQVADPPPDGSDASPESDQAPVPAGAMCPICALVCSLVLALVALVLIFGPRGLNRINGVPSGHSLCALSRGRLCVIRGPPILA